MIEAISKCISKERLSAFFMSDIYPIVICALVAVGSIFGIELYLGLVHILLVVTALCISDSIKPVLISILTFVMQISVKHSPYYPSYSDYFYTGWRVYAVIIIAAVAVLGFSAFIVRNRIYRRVSFKNTPLSLPLIPLALAFLMNGAFSERWVFGNLIFGFLNAFVFCFLPILLYHGFSPVEDSKSLAGYFSYISMLTSLVIIAELTALFLTNDGIFAGGSINKVEVALGWGIWNLVGISLSTLIPIIFYGVHRSRCPWLYFSVATLTYVFAVLTMSRNALLFGGCAYLSCVIIFCFRGKLCREFRRIATVGGVLGVAFFLIFWSEIYTLLKDYFERGFSDNGRFELWRAAFQSFLSEPMLGGGFYGLDVSDSLLFSFGPLAKQAHNTPLQLLSATGILGFFAYAYYRYSTLRQVFSRPTMEKSFMAISIAVLLFGSLLDNFIFNIYPMHFYTVALVIIYKANEEAKKLSNYRKSEKSEKNKKS